MRLIDEVIVVLFARLYSIVTKHSFISFTSRVNEKRIFLAAISKHKTTNVDDLVSIKKPPYKSLRTTKVAIFVV